jgi:predicted SAM-dependent methyltransferase
MQAQKTLRISFPFLESLRYFLTILPAGIYGWTRLSIPFLRPRDLRIVISAGRKFQSGWIPTQQFFLDITKQENWKKYFPENSVATFLAEHVFEHLDWSAAEIALQHIFKALKEGGYFRIAVPDGCHPSKDYYNAVKPGGTGLGAESHKVVYDYQKLTSVAKNVGFSIDLLEYFDETGTFHKQNWKPEDGLIHRSAEYDRRNQGGQLVYTSLIADLIKPRRD